MTGWLFVVIGVVFAIAGAGVLIAGRRRGAALRDLRRRGLRTRATVERLDEYRMRQRWNDFDISTVYTPVVSFTTADGRRIEEAKAQYGAGRPAALPGHQVEIVYDPADPTRLVVAQGSSSGRALTTGMGCLGALFLVVGLLIVVVFTLIGLTIGFPG